MRAPIRFEELTKAISAVVCKGNIYKQRNGYFQTSYPVTFQQGERLEQQSIFVHANLANCQQYKRINQVLDALTMLGRIDAETHEYVIDLVLTDQPHPDTDPDSVMADLIIAAAYHVN